MKLLLLLFYFLAARSVEVQVDGPQFEVIPADEIPQLEVVPVAPIKPAKEKTQLIVPAVPIQPAEKVPEPREEKQRE